MLGIEWMILHPVACGIAIEIITRLDGQVHVGLVNTGAQLLLLAKAVVALSNNAANNTFVLIIVCI